MDRAQTTICCSALALAAVVARTVVGQASLQTGDAPISLFPIRTAWTLTLNNQLTAPPAYLGAHAYFSIEGDRVVAYELEQGRREWVRPARPQHQPAAGDGLIFVPEDDGLRALRTSDGGTAWQLPEAGDLAVAPVWDNGWLVLGARSGELLALRAVDGQVLWRRNLGVPAHAQPSLAADRVYVPLDDGRIVALSVEQGEPIWERRLPGPVTDMLAVDDRVYAGSKDNFFYSLEARQGKVAWRWRTGADVVGVPIVDGRHVYFVSLDNVLRALSRRSGVQQWVRPLPIRPTRGPLAVGRTIIVSGVASTLRAYDMEDGMPAGEVPAGGDIAGAPYAVPTSSGLPALLVVSRDIAKGATASLVTRQPDPRLASPASLLEEIPRLPPSSDTPPTAN